MITKSSVDQDEGAIADQSRLPDTAVCGPRTVLVVAVGVVVRTVPPLWLTTGDCHTDFLTVE